MTMQDVTTPRSSTRYKNKSMHIGKLLDGPVEIRVHPTYDVARQREYKGLSRYRRYTMTPERAEWIGKWLDETELEVYHHLDAKEVYLSVQGICLVDFPE